MLTKLCAKCGRVMELGARYCPSCMEKLESRHTRYDRSVRDVRAKMFYASPEWRRLRDRVMLGAGGQCERCAANGLIKPAEEVHHKVPIGEDWGKRLDEGNLICLCHACHMELHRRMGKAQRRRGCEESLDSRRK